MVWLLKGMAMTVLSRNIKKLAFGLVFLVTVGVSLAAAIGAVPREFSTILLFIPLLWAYVALSPAGMMITGAFLGVIRLAVEVLESQYDTGHLNLARNLLESILPLALYLVLGLVFYWYRRQQQALLNRLVETNTAETRDRMAGSLVHDFNNILMMILGSCESMEKAGLSPQVRKDVEAMHQASLQGMDLVQQMRRVAPAHRARLADQDLSEVVARQMDFVQKMLPVNVHVIRRSSGRLPATFDKGQFLRVLVNLCLNAREAMPKGGVLTVSTGRRRQGSKDWATLTVSDTGGGIDLSLMERIFEPFFTTRQHAGNVGLGLSIVKSIVASHGGKIEVENIPGSGASFTVLLPMAQAEAQQPAEQLTALTG